MTEDFKNQTVIVTGAASGIGAAQAEKFITAGATVIAVDTNKDGLKKLEAKCNSGLLHTLVGDVSQPETSSKTLALVTKISDHLDIVCNTAGVLDAYKPAMDTSFADWQHILNVDLNSQFLMVKAALPKMLAQHHGVFVNMASIAGLVAGGGGIAYTAAKHAIIGMTKQLDIDYAGQGIRANCLAPGAINTPMNAADFAGDGHMAKWVASETPAKRWATAEEVADLTLFVASSKADYIHGVTIPIDGGWIAK
ncbi:NAD(P)-dependent dehydrogenase [Secundilactobacillus paracollinoides]|uniref:NAD(P)-dependent dehydrogenase n=1 Tax=Secundilactobacillus paracollinoides TaxID=240427 RepID=A0A1B2IXL6_9LACO|nr:3-oxoacyl-ACP reductase [Secundilactobacillus paracollinoides]ANZ60965.1 NAD(P)-dependent dehydrogenase [Secundilactobacillus paracollinoides]ANZ64668.1 NAD(P)-dependent dehydrogenase [Secundilactobacillus paracollinoides]ANZ66824.1 NAD(P)-dependent dehydrogenase [Secundilactobacillus paracollinoides]KRL80407.1 3-ketoacyl-(acyl-carrier-protein) reductase [Secundilactobacillus paracollinoides DSM 15502 = JCM 11969]